jgi:hypothetical protein
MSLLHATTRPELLLSIMTITVDCCFDPPFRGIFLCLTVNKSPICSIRVTSHSCGVLYPVMNCYSCNPAGMTVRVVYAEGYAPSPWKYFDYIWHGTLHYYPQIAIKILRSHLYILMSYVCHRRTDRQSRRHVILLHEYIPAVRVLAENVLTYCYLL